MQIPCNCPKCGHAFKADDHYDGWIDDIWTVILLVLMILVARAI